jgi:hypothetical protein
MTVEPLSKGEEIVQILKKTLWKRSTRVMKIEDDNEVLANNEPEGKLRVFKNGTITYFGYRLKSFDSEEVRWDPPPSKKEDVPVTWYRYEGPEVSDEVQVVEEKAKDQVPTPETASEPTPEAAEATKPIDTEHSESPEEPDAEKAEEESNKVVEPANISEILKELSDESEEVKPSTEAAQDPPTEQVETPEAGPEGVSEPVSEDVPKPPFSEGQMVEALQEDEEGPQWYPGTIAKIAYDEASKAFSYDVQWDDVAADEEQITSGFFAKDLREPAVPDARPAQPAKRPLEETFDENVKRARVEA